MNKKEVIIISIIIITIITVLSITLSKENYTIIIEPQYIHNKVYFLYEDSKFIKEIEKRINSKKLWYIDDNTIETE